MSFHIRDSSVGSSFFCNTRTNNRLTASVCHNSGDSDLSLLRSARATSPNDEILLAKVVSVIEENMENTEFNVTMLSDLMDIDGKQLYRKLKQLTGSSPVDYIRQIRMKKAAVLLAQKKFSVSEVMYMVGYTNASYFSRCFVAGFHHWTEKTPQPPALKCSLLL